MLVTKNILEKRLKKGISTMKKKNRALNDLTIQKYIVLKDFRVRRVRTTINLVSIQGKLEFLVGQQ